ncbi:MAG: hypothetical protein MUC78_09035 [Bacteroidales bacterium]|jgi:uncharacterized lipoprotein YehR (DUF1307 family)|nr:hypothetical protein [Bacteroidales bacterium]
MKRNVIILMTLVLMLAGCSMTSINDTGGRDGSSAEKAVIAGSVRSEYLYIDRAYAGSNIMSQVVTEKNGIPYDVVRIKTKEGVEKDLWFDISKFYRKKTYADDVE